MLVSQKAASLRLRKAASLVNLAEPSQYTQPGPDFARISSNLSPISSIAWSQEMRFHAPFTSFIGNRMRRSLTTSSRTAAPLQQCEPRLIGEAQPGSCPVHTPLATSAITVQPTEQCVQTFFRTVTAAPGGGGGPASALRTAPSGSAPSAARLP